MGYYSLAFLHLWLIGRGGSIWNFFRCLLAFEQQWLQIWSGCLDCFCCTMVVVVLLEIGFLIHIACKHVGSITDLPYVPAYHSVVVM
jgi:hypothetical protein